MGLLTKMLGQLGQQQNAPAQPALGSLQKTAAQPAPFQASSLPWQQQLANALDMQNSSGDAWGAIGQEGVLNYMGDSLMKRYGTNNLSDFRYIEDANTPGGYQLDWQGRQPVTGFLGGVKDASRSKGITMGNAGGEGGGDPLMTMNPSDNLSFGATWEGDGGTTFSFKRDPETGQPRLVTNAAQSNETGDILSAIAVLAGGVMAGGGLGAIGTSANVGASAAGGTAATMGAAGSAGVLPASYFTGAGSAIGTGAGMAGGELGDSAMDLASQEAMNAYGGSAGMDAAQQAGIEAMTGSGIPTSMPTATDYSQYTQQLGGSPSTPSTFNPAMDSQAANAAIDAGGGSALSGYTSGGIPSVTVNGAAGGGTSLFDSLASKAGNMEMSDWLGLASTVGGALSGGQGQQGSSSSTRAMDPRMDSLFYGDLAPKTQGLLNTTMPGAMTSGQTLMSKGTGLLGQTAPNTATNPYATGILDDLQRRQQEMIARSLQQTKGNFVGVGGLGGSRQGIAEADAITKGADNFTGQAANFMGGLYNADQNRLRQDWTIGSGLMNQGLNAPFQPLQNASQIYSPFTGFGTTTNNTQQGGGWQGAVGGALAGASFGRNMGWW
jgi:hypothetical protein